MSSSSSRRSVTLSFCATIADRISCSSRIVSLALEPPRIIARLPRATAPRARRGGGAGSRRAGERAARRARGARRPGTSPPPTAPPAPRSGGSPHATSPRTSRRATARRSPCEQALGRVDREQVRGRAVLEAARREARHRRRVARREPQQGVVVEHALAPCRREVRQRVAGPGRGRVAPEPDAHPAVPQRGERAPSGRRGGGRSRGTRRPRPAPPPGAARPPARAPCRARSRCSAAARSPPPARRAPPAGPGRRPPPPAPARGRGGRWCGTSAAGPR